MTVTRFIEARRSEYNVPDIVGERLVKSVLNSGTAYERFKEWIRLFEGEEIWWDSGFSGKDPIYN
jgi:thymidine phosphorylase